MIKNIIFDVGGVLLEWNPTKILHNLHLPITFHDVFESLLWAMHDGGLISREELLQKLPSHLDKASFSYCMQHISSQLSPIEEIVDLFHELRTIGYKVYILSNMPYEMHQELVSLHDFFKCPEGSVFSYEVKAIKPQPQIYEALLKKYQLIPEESIFIDDREENLRTAKKLKIEGIHCTSATHVKKELVRWGIIGTGTSKDGF